MNKRTFTGLLAGLVLAVACSKSETTTPGGDSFAGNWIEVQKYISPGGSTDWEPAGANPMQLTISDTGAYTAANVYAYFLQDSGRFEFKSDSSLIVHNRDENYEVRGWLSSRKDTLEIWGQCYEGCAWRFIRK